MPQVSYRSESKKTKAPRFFKSLFSSSDNNQKNDINNPVNTDLFKCISYVENTSLKSSSFLNHLLKDNQFIVKLSEEDVAAARIDIDYLKSYPHNILKKIKQSIKEADSVDTNGIIDLLNKTDTDILVRYIESAKRLSKTISKSYEEVRKKERGINDYSFIELIARLSATSAELKSSKNVCINTLKLKVGNEFGYNLQLNIVGSFNDPYQARLVKEIQGYGFLYPINYAMILNGEMLPDVKLLKSHLFKIKSLAATKIDSIITLNDPYDELEKILPVTEILKAEITLSTEHIKDTEKYIEESIDAFIENKSSDTHELTSTLNVRINNLTNLTTAVQTERIELTEEVMQAKLPKVNQKDYLTLNSYIHRRLLLLKDILITLGEIYSRNRATVHPFNLDVFKASLTTTKDICKSERDEH